MFFAEASKHCHAPLLPSLLLLLQAPQHSPPDVAQQLLRLCQVSPECHVRLLQAQVRKQAVQLGERQQQVEALTGQLTAAQQHVERLTQLLAQHGECVGLQASWVCWAMVRQVLHA